MKKQLLILILVLSANIINVFAQTSGPNDPAAAVCVPSSACLACPGSLWNSPTNIFLQDNSNATTGLNVNGSCFQSTCYYSRFLYASNFGFAIPGSATVNGVTVEIYRSAVSASSVVDSSLRLVQGGVPAGMNKADVTPWTTTGAYFTYGSSSDTWGLTLLPSDINATTFGTYLRVYNMSNVQSTANVDHIRITVDYTMATGIHTSQTGTASAFNAFQNDNELQVAFILSSPAAKVSLKLFDILGKMRAEKQLSTLSEGMNLEKIPSANLAPGIYFIQLDAGAGVMTKKIIIRN